jgi:hypothetical protein
MNTNEESGWCRRLTPAEYSSFEAPLIPTQYRSAISVVGIERVFKGHFLAVYWAINWQVFAATFP